MRLVYSRSVSLGHMNIRTALITKIWSETPSLTGVRLKGSQDIHQEHQAPGQILVVQNESERPMYLVLSSAPGADQFELLLGQTAAEALNLGEGTEVRFTGPSGSGFPFEKARGRDVLIFAMGSAAAAVRPVIEKIRADRSDFGWVNVYFGAREAKELPYQAAYDLWRRDRIDLSTSLSPEYVQDTFANDPLALDDAVAFVCGTPEMMDQVTETVGRFGLGSERVFRNW